MRLFELFNSGSLLIEKRRAGGLAPKRSTIEELEKYRGQEDIFVSYTSDVGVNSHGNKLRTDTAFKGGVTSKKGAHNVRGMKFGINPKSQYDTPIGIYSYPVDYVIKEKGVVPFAGNEPYIQVFRAGGNILDLAKYSRADLIADSEKIQAILDQTGVQIRIDVDRADRHALVHTPGGVFWNVSRIAAMYLTNIANGVHGNPDARGFVDITYGADDDEDESPNDEDTEWENDDDDDDWNDDEDPDWEDHDDEAEEEDTNESMIVEAEHKATVRARWSKLLRDLGYDGVVDRKNDGVIHENEPTQAVFFTKKNLQLLEVVDNRSETREPRGYLDIYFDSPSSFLRDLKRGKVPAELATKVMNKNLGVMIPLIPFDALPKETQEFFEKNWIEFVYFGFIQLIRWMPISDEQRVELIKAHPDTVSKFWPEEFTPAVMAYLNANALKFSHPSFLDKIPFSTEALMEIIKREPSIVSVVFSTGARVEDKAPRFKNDKLLTWIMSTYPNEFQRLLNASIMNLMNPKVLDAFFAMTYHGDTGIKWTHLLTMFSHNNARAFEQCFMSLPIHDAAEYAEYFEVGHSIFDKMVAMRPEIPDYIEKHGLRTKFGIKK